MAADGAAPAAVVVKADVHGWLSHCRRITFADRSQLDKDTLHRKLATAFALQPGSFRLAYRDDDNDLIEVATPADLHESLEFFSYGSSNASTSTSSQQKRPGTVTMRLQILVDYDGPALSEAGTGLAGSGSGAGGFSSVGPSRTGPLSAISRAGTTISTAATDREGALARWKAEQDALAFQFSRVAVRETSLSGDREEERHFAAQEREYRNTRRRFERAERERMQRRQRERNLEAMERNRERRIVKELRRTDSGPSTPNATVPFLSTLHDGSSGDEWIRERAFDKSHGVPADDDAKSDHTTSSAAGPVELDAGESIDDDDDWDRETVSSFLPFGGAAARQMAVHDGGPSDAQPLFGYGRASLMDSREIDHLHPNFASHFIATEDQVERYLPPGVATPNGTGNSEEPDPTSGAGRLPFRSYLPDQGPQIGYAGFSPMFSSPSGSSMYSYAPDSRYGPIDAESTYRPTGSERARVDALFAPSEYGSTSIGVGVADGSRDAVSAAQPELNSEALDATSVWSEALEPTSEGATRRFSGTGDGEATPEATDSTASATATATATATAMTLVQEESASEDLSCAVCSDAITGIRYMCIQCDGYNLCEACEDDPSTKLAARKKRSATLSSRMWTRQADEYIPMLHDSNHVLLKIRPGATVPPALALLASRPSSASLSTSASASTSSSVPIPPPAPPLSAPPIPLPFLGRTKTLPVRMPSDGPTRLTRPNRDAAAPPGPQQIPLVPGFTIPAVQLPSVGVNIPAVNVPAVNVPAVNAPVVNVPAVNIPPVHIPAIHVPPLSVPLISSLHAHSANGSQLVPYAMQPPTFKRFDSVIERNHGVNCSHCGELIPTGHGEAGARYLCGNCPTMPGYNLCPKCERDSAQIHDPTHAFLRLTHRLQRPLPSLRSGLVPLLYIPTTPKSETGSDSTQSETPDATETSSMVLQRPNRDRVVCDACGQLILEEWMMCCHCPISFDLCRTCLVDRDASNLARHNPSHVFLQLKEKVDLDLLKQVTRFTSRRPRGLIEWDLYA